LKPIIVFYALITAYSSFSQCNIISKWGTMGYEDHETSLVMFFPLIFELRPDTITIYNANVSISNQNIKYVVKQSKCTWTTDGLSGEAEYYVNIVKSGKNAKLLIKVNNGQGDIDIRMESQDIYSPKFKVQRIIE